MDYNTNMIEFEGKLAGKLWMRLLGYALKEVNMFIELIGSSSWEKTGLQKTAC